MKRSIIVLALAGFVFSACSNNPGNTATHQKKGRYTCPMHPDVFADKPGVCPKCGMDLVERDTTDDK